VPEAEYPASGEATISAARLESARFSSRTTAEALKIAGSKDCAPAGKQHAGTERDAKMTATRENRDKFFRGNLQHIVKSRVHNSS
jgi:hypothetical protein